MEIKIDKVYQPVDDYFYLNLTLDFGEDENDRVQNIIHQRFNDLATGLREEFEEQRKLYDVINKDYIKDDYHPGAYYFSPSDNGWRRFVKDMTEAELQMLTDIYANLIIAKMEHIRDMYAQQTTQRMTISMVKTGENAEINLEDTELKTIPMIMLGNKVVGVEFKEIEGVETLEDIKKQSYESLRKNYEAQLRVVKTNADKRITRLKQLFEKEKNELFADILKNSQDVLTNWEFEKIGNELFLKYKHRIVMDKVLRRGRIYDYPGDLQNMKEFYVSGLKVRVTPFIHERDVRITRGVNVHFNRPDRCCIGTLNGQPLFNVLRDIPETLKTANMDSPLNEELASYIRSEFLGKVSERDDVQTRSTWRLD